MTTSRNDLGQPVGAPLPVWHPPPTPSRTSMLGRYCRLEPLDIDNHAASLYAAYALDSDGRDWTYLSYGPFPNLKGFCDWLEASCLGEDPLFFTILDRETDEALGMVGYLRIKPGAGSIEVGHIHYAPPLKRTPMATEAMFLMMERAFALGYRRYEWKCDHLNTTSRSAALRLGFSYEGTFRHATVYKGRNRDTAWYAIIDTEWHALRQGYRQWLSPENFDSSGQQRRSLSSWTRTSLVRED